jgi:hypothetical protein
VNEELFQEYADRLHVLLPMARKAYGSRNTISPQHDASREYTRLLVEFYAKGGSLLQMADSLGVTYAGLRRRVMTDQIPASKKNRRSKATPEEVAAAVERIKIARSRGTTSYHEQIRMEYEDHGISLAKIAKGLGISSANPLYYAVARMKVDEVEMSTYNND